MSSPPEPVDRAGWCSLCDHYPARSPPARAPDAGDTVKALNDRDWKTACELSVVSPGMPCEELLESAFDGFRGPVTMEGAYFDRAEGADAFAFSLENAPDGFSAGEVEQHGGRLLVHWEAQIVR